MGNRNLFVFAFLPFLLSFFFICTTCAGKTTKDALPGLIFPKEIEQVGDIRRSSSHSGAQGDWFFYANIAKKNQEKGEWMLSESRKIVYQVLSSTNYLSLYPRNATKQKDTKGIFSQDASEQKDTKETFQDSDEQKDSKENFLKNMLKQAVQQEIFTGHKIDKKQTQEINRSWQNLSKLNRYLLHCAFITAELREKWKSVSGQEENDLRLKKIEDDIRNLPKVAYLETLQKEAEICEKVYRQLLCSNEGIIPPEE